MRTGLLLAVNHSGDSDSTGSITGNLLGVLHGASALPADLVESLEGHELVEEGAADWCARMLDNEKLPVDRYPTY